MKFSSKILYIFLVIAIPVSVCGCLNRVMIERYDTRLVQAGNIRATLFFTDRKAPEFPLPSGWRIRIVSSDGALKTEEKQSTSTLFRSHTDKSNDVTTAFFAVSPKDANTYLEQLLSTSDVPQGDVPIIYGIVDGEFAASFDVVWSTTTDVSLQEAIMKFREQMPALDSIDLVFIWKSGVITENTIALSL